MKHYLITAAVLLSMLTLSGCGTQTADQQESTATEPLLRTSETESSAETTTTALMTQTEETTQTHSSAEFTQTTPAETDAVTTQPTETYASLLTTAPPAETPHQGGEGGEEHGSDPDPLYFTYRFTAEGVSMRLAGGNYQVISYDFSGAADDDLIMQYRLEDCNFDGYSDLIAPTGRNSFGDIQYAVFLWDAETAYYLEEPLLLTHPAIDTEHKTICELEQTGDDTEVLRQSHWTDGSLTELLRAEADFSTLHLTLINAEDGSQEESDFDDSDALTEALLSLYSPQ